MSETLSPEAEVTPEVTPEVVAEDTPETEADKVDLEAPAPKAQRAKRVSRDDFLEVWETVVDELKNGSVEGSGIDIVAARTGLKPNTVQQRSTTYRRKYGLALSNMPRGGGARFNSEAATDSLNAIKERIAAKRAEAEIAQQIAEAEAEVSKAEETEIPSDGDN